MKLSPKYLLLPLCLFVAGKLFSQQSSDEGYRKPLKEVLVEIEKRYGVQLKYADSLVAGKTVSYADWRFRPDVEVTLSNVLSPLDMKVRK